MIELLEETFIDCIATGYHFIEFYESTLHSDALGAERDKKQVIEETSYCQRSNGSE